MTGRRFLERIRSRWVSLALILLSIGTALTLMDRYRTLSTAEPKGGNLFIFFLINANILLLTLLVFLLARNVIKLVVEGRRRVFGYRLKAKLVAIFVGFSLVPTFLLFFVARGFISDSIEYWFNLNVEQAVEGAVIISQEYYSTLSNRCRILAQRVSERLAASEEEGDLDTRLEALRYDYSLSIVEVFDQEGRLTGRAWDGQSPQNFTERHSSLVQNALVGRFIDSVSRADRGEFIRAAAPFTTDAGRGAVVVSIHLPEDIRLRSEALASTYRGYTEMKLQKNPIRANYLVYLLFLAMLILFSASWLGFYLARGITGPIGQLAEGAERVAAGDLSVRVGTTAQDEIGILVKSFNRMTSELQRTTSDLEKASHEDEKRRVYIETVLREVGTGVVSLDSSGRINTFNRAAESMFGVKAEEILGNDFHRVLSSEHAQIVEVMLDDVRTSGRRSIQREVPVVVRGNPMVLMVNAGLVEGQGGEGPGAVLVVEDMTRLISAQRKAAWSEAAKRIAHEIKNPLTPIKLSAERLRRRLEDKVEDGEAQVLKECTDSIIREVEAMRGLVDEFSQFARLPALRPTATDLNETVQDAVSLYGAGRAGGARIRLALSRNLPRASYDREQIRRVIINLLDNAIRASQEAHDSLEVVVATQFMESEGMVAVSVTDHGPGVPDSVRDRIFDPYFSTREGGTGLGLAIARRIIEEHGGGLTYQRGETDGSVFTVLIPVDIEPARRPA